MPSYGLIGALGGLGEAMEGIGKGIEERRATALKWAQETARQQREREDKVEDRRLDREGKIELADIQRDNAIAVAQERGSQALTVARERTGGALQVADRRNEGAAARQAAALAARREQITLSATLQRQNTAEAIKLRDKIKGVGVTYSAIAESGPNRGKQQVITIDPKTGGHRETGAWVRLGGRTGARQATPGGGGFDAATLASLGIKPIDSDDDDDDDDLLGNNN